MGTFKVDHASYLRGFFNQAQHGRMVEAMKQKLEEIRASNPFEFIVITGNSGAFIGPTLSYLTGIPFIYVRKEDVNSCHSHTKTEGRPLVPSYRYLIVDDLICTGDTIRRTMEALKPAGTPVGVLLYLDCESFRNFQTKPGEYVGVYRCDEWEEVASA